MDVEKLQYMMQHPGPAAGGRCCHFLWGQKSGSITRTEAAQPHGEGCPSDRSWSLQQRRGQMPHSCLLHVPLCPLPVGVSRWPSPTRSQRARDQPLGYREGLESGGRRKMSSLGSRDVIFFFKDFNKCCEFACQKCSNFLTPHW